MWIICLPYHAALAKPSPSWRISRKSWPSSGNSPSSLAAAGSHEETPDPERLPQVKEFLVLGHTLADNGSIRSCWQRTKEAMWRAFWANAGSQSARGLPTPLKVRLLTRSVLPVLDYRSSRWPPQKTIGLELDSLQCKMAASIIRVQRLAGESPADYFMRRNRDASRLCRRMGLWSTRWFSRALSWDAHIRRPRNSHLWSADVVMYRGKTWLQQRRASFFTKKLKHRIVHWRPNRHSQFFGCTVHPVARWSRFCVACLIVPCSFIVRVDLSPARNS